MVLYRFLRFLLVFSAFITMAAPLPARAQMCATPFEVIVTLRPPTFGFPTVWDAKYTVKDSMVQLASGVPQEDGTVFVVGRSLSQKNFRPQDILLADINRRGRALKEHRYPAKTAEQPVKMIQIGKELIVISNMLGGEKNEQKWVRISWYDEDGKYKRDLIIKDSTFDFEAMTLVKAVEGPGFLAVLHGVNRSDTSDENGLLMRFSPKGELEWRRAYRPGIPNELTNLIPVDKTSYIATGRIRLDDGRIAAWALRLGFDGGVRWQRTYPRGSYSVFSDAAVSQKKTSEGQGFVLSGDSMPYDDGPKAAWVMAIDALGEPQWQRYFRRPDYELGGNWLKIIPDGRIELMMNAKAIEGQGGEDHIRLLTLSPRGAMIGDEAYHQGLKATATDFADGMNGERIFTATIEEDQESNPNKEDDIVVIGLASGEGKPKAEPPPKKPIYKGWVLVATALDAYQDPCANRK